MIANTLQQKIGEAMKAHDEVRLSTLRMLKSAFGYEQIEKQHDLNYEEELAVIAREAKKRKEAIEVYKKVNDKNANAKLEQEEKELQILEEFLPEQISDEELEKIVDEAVSKSGATEIKDMGKVIGIVKSKVGATAEGSKIAQMVKSKLAS